MQQKFHMYIIIQSLTSSISSNFLKSPSVMHLPASVFSCSRSDSFTPSLKAERSKVESVAVEDIPGVE